jgi:hypothetical protein
MLLPGCAGARAKVPTDLPARLQGGRTALHLAAEQGHEDAARLLADKDEGAYINFTSKARSQLLLQLQFALPALACLLPANSRTQCGCGYCLPGRLPRARLRPPLLPSRRTAAPR